MANAIYPKCKEQLWQGGINLSTATVKAILIDSADYTYSATHEFLSDVAAAGRVATSPALGTKTFTNGVFDCADYTFTAVSGDISEALIYYIDTGVEATSRLIAFKDTGLTGFPFTPNGGDANVTVDTGGNGVAAL